VDFAPSRGAFGARLAMWVQAALALSVGRGLPAVDPVLLAGERAETFAVLAPLGGIIIFIPVMSAATIPFTSTAGTRLAASAHEYEG
jgi:hypothetical protein